MRTAQHHAQSRLEYLPLASLVSDPRNPRKHDRHQVQAIASSLNAFGFNAPILIDKQRRIIAGHGRLEAAKLVGLAEVPVICLDHLTEAQARAYMLADNKLTDRSGWDDGLLATHLKELSELALDFNLEATGFELPEIDLRIQSLEPSELCDPADVFQSAAGPAVTHAGDLWHLGSHRVLCASALEDASFATLLGDAKAAAAFTDPPYNVKVVGHVGGRGATKHREFAMASGEMSEEAFTVFLSTALKGMADHLEPGAVSYTCMDWRHLGELTAAASGAGLQLLNLCVWVKTNGGMGSLYRSQHELVFTHRNGSTAHRNNVQLGRFGRNRSNVWHYPGANSFPRKGRTKGLAVHPTSKPIALVADAIRDVTKPGDIVLDPFLGGGTTVLAAERTGRRGYGLELDPLYVDTVVLRWEQMTGQQARDASGSSFATVKAARGHTA